MLNSTQFKLSWRLFFKNTETSILNVAGLSTGLAAAILIWLWVDDELSVDKFHKNNSRIYQVIKNSVNGDSTIDTNESTPARMASMMKDELPEVELAAPVVLSPGGLVHYEHQTYRAAPYFTTAEFFGIFSYPLLTPRPNKLLQSPDEALISDRLAQTIFGTTHKVVGRTIEWQDEEPSLSHPYKIAGIFSAPPPNTTQQFDIVFSFDHYYKTLRAKYGLDLWYSNNPHTYLLLRKGTDLAAFNQKIRNYGREKMLEQHGENLVKYEGDVFVQRYSDKYLHNRYENGKIAGGRIEYVRLFSIVGICILVLACINFMNLTTSRATTRIREVGVRKIVGANRTTLIVHYLTESVIIAFVSLLIAVTLVQLFLPQFQNITGKQIANIRTGKTAWTVLMITVVTGLIAGCYPALLISSFKPAHIFRPAGTLFRSQGTFRKALVVVQLGLSILFIISVMVVNNQMKLIRQKNLGFNKDNVIRISAEGSMKQNIEPFLNEIRNINGVQMASAMEGDLVGSNGGGGGISWPGQQPGHEIEFDGLDVSDQWIETMGIEMAAGRTFAAGHVSDSLGVIFNETAINLMNIKDPLGKPVIMWGQERTIIGIVKDFHYESLYNKPGPMFLRLASEVSAVVAKLRPGDESSTINHIAELFGAHTNGLEFDFRFMDEDFNKLYAAENRVARLSGLFTVLAVIISCLGLLGLVSFTVTKREKEIGIRKVVGARTIQIAILLSWDFIRLTLIALCIALPVGTIILNNWLNDFYYRVDIDANIYLVASGLILIVTLLTASLHSIRAAFANPAKTLKTE